MFSISGLYVFIIYCLGGQFHVVYEIAAWHGWLFVEDAGNVGEYVLNGIVALYLAVVALTFVVGDKGLCLLVIGGDAVLDGGPVHVVLAVLDHGPVEDAVVHQLVLQRK